MRLNLRLTANTTAVSFNHLHHLTGCLHKWLGANNAFHDRTSLYSVSWLQNGERRGENLHFPKGARWSLSFFDEGEDVIAQVRRGIEKDSSVAFGMSVYKTEKAVTPAFAGLYRFEVGSPVLARRNRGNGQGRDHLTYEDPEADAALTRTLKTKLKRAGFEGAHLDVIVGFDRSYPKPYTKVVRFREAKFKTSVCPVIVAGTPEAVQFAYDVGVGELTGCGMGFIKSVT